MNPAPPIHHRTGETGTVTVWMLGMLIMVLALGGLSVDLWRVFDARRAVAGIVDAAAIAGASGIDADHYHHTGEIRLDPDRAHKLAAAQLATHSDSLTDGHITVAPDGSAVTVAASREMSLTLLRLAGADTRSVGARAVGTPERVAP